MYHAGAPQEETNKPIIEAQCSSIHRPLITKVQTALLSSECASLVSAMTGIHAHPQLELSIRDSLYSQPHTLSVTL